ARRVAPAGDGASVLVRGPYRARGGGLPPALGAAGGDARHHHPRALWALWRMPLPTVTWFLAGTSQLASTAASRILPGGNATGSVVQASMLIKHGQQGPAGGAAPG